MNNLQRNGGVSPRRRNYLISLFSVIAALSLTLPPVVRPQNQSREMNQEGDALLEKATDFNPPVKITLVKSRIGIIEPDKKLTADEDWVKGLTVTVRNDSKKPLTHVSLHVRFRRPQEQKNAVDFVESLNYGESPIPTADGQTLYNSAQAIMPGESVELKLSDEDFSAVKTALRESNYPVNIKRIKISVALLGFDDGTIWMAGKMYRLDKDNAGRLIPLQKKRMI